MFRYLSGIIRFATIFLLVLGINSGASAASKWSLSSKDLSIAKQSNSYANRDRWKDAAKHASTAKEKVVFDVYQWRKFRVGSKYTTWRDITDFIQTHPDWPDMELLLRRAEDAIQSDTPPEEIVNWFLDKRNGPKQSYFRDPLTPKGKQMLGDALIKLEQINPNRALILRLIRESWIEGNFTEANEKQFYMHHNDRLRAEDHVERAERLLWEGKISPARRLLHLVDDNSRKLFEARIALLTFAGGIDDTIAAVPKRLRNDEGLLYDRIKWRLAKRRPPDSIIELLQLAPEKSKHPHYWWKLKKRYLSHLMSNGNYALAYDWTSKHGFDQDIGKLAEAEWLAGWIALRFTHEPRLAYRHFYTMYQRVKTPISLGRAAYWAGRAAEVNNNEAIARRWYKVATDYPNSFYGQLATEKAGYNTLILKPVDQPVVSDANRYVSNPLLKAAYILHKVGEYGLAQRFVKQAVENTESEGEKLLIARLGKELDHPTYGIVAAKQAAKDNGPLILSHYYPILPETTTRISAPELALVHAIILQESQFNPVARSHVGALGLMQLMPRTANEIARKTGVRYQRNRLTSDPIYNAVLGSAYLNERLKQWDGSYILAIASYNAGAGNVQKWVERMGDPRLLHNKDDIIDWIEMIPFEETKNYVQRVLEHLQVYRYMMDTSQPPYVRLSQDLVRGG